jgi:uncharacterized protein (TIGR03382 family)
VSFGFGQTVGALSLMSISEAIAAAEGEPVELTDDVVLTLEADVSASGIQPAVYESQALVDGDLAELLLLAFQNAEDLTDLDVATAIAMGLPVITDELDDLPADAMYYVNLSAADFLDLVALGEAELIIGTQGGAIVPTYDSDGNAVGARLSTFLVTDASGTLTTIVTPIPEPGTLAVAGLVAAGLLVRRR